MAISDRAPASRGAAALLRPAGLTALAAVSWSCADVALEPQLEAAWVAIRPQAAEVARVGGVELAAGEEFVLHAVLEARDWQGRTVYYTEAPGLEIGGRRVAGDAVRRWDRRLRVRNLWFTVEAFPPYAESGEIVYRDVFRGDWPLTWTVAGEITPSVENYLPNQQGPRRGDRFGTQRYKVRIEVLGPQSDILARYSLESWGAERMPDEAAAFPTVIVELPFPLARLSRVFGLPQREPADGDRAATLRQIADWQRHNLAFSRLTLLRSWLDDVGSTFPELAWEEVDLDGADDFAPAGEPLRVGERVVWLFEDRGVAGHLDREDLCLDFERGARVRPLNDVFTGAGLVERARLAGEQRTGRKPR